ncbi:MAG: hypothetical protein ACLSVG_07245 [Clostridia bacterium]
MEYIANWVYYAFAKWATNIVKAGIGALAIGIGVAATVETGSWSVAGKAA